MANHFNEHFTGERALFMIGNSYIEGCSFDDGESPLKEGKYLDIVHCNFFYKYPLWYCEGIKIVDTTFHPIARAGIWYTKGVHFSHCQFDCPKAIRKCIGVSLEDVEFTDGAETLWWNKGVRIVDANVAKADYFCMGSEDIDIDHLDLQGNYAFDGCKDLTIRNSVLRTKDAFWNCENVLVENCYIEGEYFGWNAKNVTLVHCEIRSHQGFCYMENVKLVDCRVVDSDLTFEYCKNIDAEILTKVDSIKNPISGKIVCKEVGELILDDLRIDPRNVEIIHG